MPGYSRSPGGYVRRSILSTCSDYVNFGINLFAGVENPEMTNEDLISQYEIRTFGQTFERRPLLFGRIRSR
jgi:hypothetical protein